MPSPFLTALVRGNSGGDPVVGRMVGLTQFESVGDQTVFTGVGLEDTVPNASFSPTNRVRQLADRAFFYHKNVVYELIPSAANPNGVWTSVFTVANQNTGFAFGEHGGFHFWQDLATGNFGLAAWYKTNTNVAAVLRYDYGTNAWSTHVSASALGSGHVQHQSHYFRGLLRMLDGTGGSLSFNPVTLAFATSALPTATFQNVWLLVANNSLFMARATNNPVAQFDLFQLVGGAWVNLATITGVGLSANWLNNARLGFYYSHGALWVVYVNAALDAMRSFEISLSTFAVTERLTLLPPYLRNSNATGTIEDTWRFFRVVDQEDPLGTPKTLLLWQSDATQGAQNVFEHVQPGDGSTASWADRGSSQLTGAYSIPDYPQGGSDGVYTSGELFSLVTMLAAADQGVDATMRFWGDPVKVNHGAVAGGPFEAGETLQQTTGAGSGTVATIVRALADQVWLTNVVPVGPGFENGETIQQTTGPATGANATTTSAQSGGAADKFGRLRYNTGENRANDVSQLVAPAGGLQAPMTLNGNDYETVRADGFTDYPVKHETLAQAIPNAAPISYFSEVERP